MRVDDLQLDREQSAELCRRYGVARLEVCGSFARGDAEPGSVVAPKFVTVLSGHSGTFRGHGCHLLTGRGTEWLSVSNG